MKFTRQDYMSGICTHNEYYSQFVTERILSIVENMIGIDTICNSTDKYFNDIALSKWDDVAYVIGKANPLSDGVCIAKQAARIIKANHK